MLLFPQHHPPSAQKYVAEGEWRDNVSQLYIDQDDSNDDVVILRREEEQKGGLFWLGLHCL